uniref:Uncharacterized protein n=1 Tax=Solanum tuberosum TaxID=4113 RepID=M1DJM7_SOLTU
MHNYYGPATASAPNVVANSQQEVPFPGQYRVDDGPRFTQSQYENICHMLDKNQVNQMQEQSHMNTTHSANMTGLHTLFPQPELYHDNDPLLPITINHSTSLQQLTSSNNDTSRPTDVAAVPHMVQPIAESVSQPISQLQQKSAAQPTRKSTRGIHPPCWMKELSL